MNLMYNKEFLRELDCQRNKTMFARIIALDFMGRTLEQIDGLITGGSISLDGKSSVRRTCNLTMVSPIVNINDFYWGLNTKVKIEIGVKNTVSNKYPDIIWFPQGIFILNTFSMNEGVNNFTITLSGKDKMCLLNGEIGGILSAISTDFANIEDVLSDGSVKITKIPVETIIREAIHTYGQEPYHNIVITDLNDVAVELLEYRGDKSLYFFRDQETDSYINYTTDETMAVFLPDGSTKHINKLDAYYSRVDLNNSLNLGEVRLKKDGKIYNVAKIEPMETIGYRATDLTYPGELIANAGESITSVLDKIVNMLGNFEYFYDIDGRFIFQRKKTYTDNPWTTISTIKDEDMDGDINYTQVEAAAGAAAYDYKFTDSLLLTSFQSTPDLKNVKNDFSVWGERNSTSGAKVPIHYRFAIDKKPTVYTSITVTQEEADNFNQLHSMHMKPQQGKTYYATSNELLENEIIRYDWRELIYQMAKDYYAYNQLDDFALKLKQANPNMIYGYTGYEQYYIDIQAFWRDLYLTNNEYADIDKNYQQVNEEFEELTTLVDKQQLAVNMATEKRKSYDRIHTNAEMDKSDTIADLIAQVKECLPKDKKDLETIDDMNFSLITSTSVTGLTLLARRVVYCSILHKYFNYPKFDFTVTLEYDPVEEIEAEEDETEEEAQEREEKNKRLKTAQERQKLIDNKYLQFFKYFTWSNIKDKDKTIADLKALRKLIADNSPYNYSTTFSSAVLELTNAYLKRVQEIESAENTVYTQNMSMLNSIVSSAQEALNEVQGKLDTITRQRDHLLAQKDSFIADPLATPEVKTPIFEKQIDEEGHEKEILIRSGLYHSGYWNKDIDLNPASLNFWFDFLDAEDADMSQFSVPSIGIRPKVVKDSKVTSIYNKITPNVLFTDADNFKIARRYSGYTPLLTSGNLDSLITISTQGKSAKEALDDLLYNYSYCMEKVTINSIPIYYLSPNTRIYIYDENSGINGEYIIEKISLQLSYNGMMNITATKAVTPLVL